LDLRIERTAAPNKLLILALNEHDETVFDVQVRRWPSTSKWIGIEIGPVIEIDWLEVKEEFRSTTMTFRALCEALSAALSLAGGTVPAIGMDIDNDRLEAKLERRSDFHRIDVGEVPRPFVASRNTIHRLASRACK